MPDGKALADPPLLRLEGEACHAYLSMLLHLNTAASEPLQEAADVERRLMQLCIANLRCFQVCTPAPGMQNHKLCKSVCQCRTGKLCQTISLIRWCLTRRALSSISMQTSSSSILICQPVRLVGCSCSLSQQISLSRETLCSLYYWRKAA